MMEYVRHHPKRLIEQLLDWAAANAEKNPAAVIAIGLAYLHGLNEHQIAAARVSRAATLTITYPRARRRREIVDPSTPWTELAVGSVNWLGQAAAQLVEQVADGELLIRPGRRMQIPVHAGAIRRLVTQSAATATGTRMTVATLVSSRVIAVQEARLPFALYRTGHAASWSARLLLARPALILPRQVT
jgi:hypothetical protein